MNRKSMISLQIYRATQNQDRSRIGDFDISESGLTLDVTLKVAFNVTSGVSQR